MANLNVRGDASVDNIAGSAPVVGGSPNAAGLKIEANSSGGNYLAFTNADGNQTWGYFTVDSSGNITWSGISSSLTSPYVRQYTYDSVGTHTWTKPTIGTYAQVIIWGGGGSGANRGGSGTAAASGGGGGACAHHTFLLTNLPSTVTITIGPGGAAQSTNATGGNVGGSSTFGSYITAGGGAAGRDVNTAPLNAVPGGTSTFNIPLSFQQIYNGSLWEASPATPQGDGGSGIFAGGSGGGTTASNPGKGGNSVWGGAGGGGSVEGGGSNSGGTSVYGGNGGSGGAGTTQGGAGGFPGGGGGGSEATSGKGGDGRCIIYVW